MAAKSLNFEVFMGELTRELKRQGLGTVDVDSAVAKARAVAQEDRERDRRDDCVRELDRLLPPSGSVRARARRVLSDLKRYEAIRFPRSTTPPATAADRLRHEICASRLPLPGLTTIRKLLSAK